jgi:hypothetical protein
VHSYTSSAEPPAHFSEVLHRGHPEPLLHMPYHVPTEVHRVPHFVCFDELYTDEDQPQIPRIPSFPKAAGRA